MKRKLSLIVLCVTLTAMIVLSSCSEPVEEPMPLPEVTKTEAEKPRLQDDFYGYVNWDFIDSTQIPNGRSGTSIFSMQQDLIDERLNNLIDEYAEGNYKKGSNEQKIKDMYLQYLDDEEREKVGIEPLMDGINTIEEVTTPDEYVQACAYVFYNYGCTGIFNPMGDLDAYDSSKYIPTFYLMNTFGGDKASILSDDSLVNSIGQFADYVLRSLDVPDAEAKKRASDIISMIYDIELESLDREDLFEVSSIYNPFTSKELSEIYTNIDTKALFKAFDVNTKKLVITDVGQAKKINEYLTEEHLRALKDYAIMSIFASYRSCLPSNYNKALDMVKEGVYDKEEAAKDFVRNVLSDEFSSIYSERYLNKSVKNDVEKMIDDIKNAAKESINESDRLSDDGKKKLIKKLNTMISLVGDYDEGYTGDYEIVPANKGGSLLQNAVTMTAYHYVELYKTKPERTRSNMLTQTVNAQYNPTLNSITIPAAIMGEYFYDSEKPYASNLGSLGSCIAHEMNHAFDSHGYMYDENGCYNENWFSQEDKEAYKKVQADIAEYYHNYKVMNVYRVNGELTLGENIADLGGMECILRIVDSKEDKRLLLESYAYTDASLDSASSVVFQMSTDEHSPNEARVNALVSTLDDFYKVYDISSSDSMYIAPENRVKVW